MYQRKLLPSREADDSKLQFEEFIDNVVKCNSDMFLSFNICLSSLDAFCGQWLHRDPNFSSLWKVICILTFSHCQGEIERGFSINKSLLAVNMYEKSICAQWLVSDFVKSSNKEVHEIGIENE